MPKINDTYDQFHEDRRIQRLAIVAGVFRAAAKVRAQAPQDESSATQNLGAVHHRRALTAEQMKDVFAAQKDAVNQPFSQGGEDAATKDNLNVTTPWTILIEQAKRAGPSIDSSTSSALIKSISDNPLTRLALVKAVRDISVQTGLDTTNVQEILLTRLMSDRASRQNLGMIVRFFCDADPDWMAECSHCGSHNDLPWDFCSHCHLSQDGKKAPPPPPAKKCPHCAQVLVLDEGFCVNCFLSRDGTQHPDARARKRRR